MCIVKIEIPLEFEVTSINSYLIKEDPVTLIDPGPYSKFYIEFLESKLKEQNLLFSDIKRILLTHGHTDHAGMAGYLQQKYNSEIYIHSYDKEKITATIEEKILKRKLYYAPLLKNDGFPDDIVNFLINFVGNFYKFVFKAEDIEYLKENMLIEFEKLRLKVIFTPGHTAGHCCFDCGNFIFTGDTILKNTFVTPLLEFDENGIRRKNLINLFHTLENMKNFIKKKWFISHGDDSFNKLNRINEIKNKIINSLIKLKKIFNPRKTNYENFMNFYKNPEKEKMLFYISYFYGLLDFLKN